MRTSESRVIAVIPARYASSRFPGKPLASIAGVPLVLRVYERVRQALDAEQIVIATEDDRIRWACEAQGVRVAMTPDTCLTGTDRVYEATKHLDVDVVLNVQGDEPLIQGADIRAILSAKLANLNAVANGACEIHDEDEIHSPNVPKVVTDERLRMLYMSRAPIPFSKSGVAPAYLRQVCIYAFTPSELRAFAMFGRKGRLEAIEDIEILRFLELGVPVQMVKVSGWSMAVDVPADVERVERVLAAAAPTNAARV